MSRVQSIERAFAVLSALADGPIGVTEVAQRVGVPKSTAARLLTALWHEGAVEQEAGGTRYRLGPRIADLAARHVPTRDLVGVARPHLVELATAAGEVAGLSVPDGRVVHYVDQVGTAHEVQVRDWTGSRVPMHAVPSGQVMLAGLAPAALERFLATPLEAFTPATLVDPETLARAPPGSPPRRLCLGPRRVQRGDWLRLRRRWWTATARCSPPSTSTVRRTASRHPARASASPSESRGLPDGFRRSSEAVDGREAAAPRDSRPPPR